MAFTPQGVPTQGLGFAIPADVVRNSIAQFKAIAQKQPAENTPAANSPISENADHLFGLQLQDLTPELADALGYARNRGVLVSGVEPGSPADEAGIERGLVIYRIGKYDVKSVKQVNNLLERAHSDSKVDFTIGIVRANNGAQRIARVTLVAR
jgi:S1-C subfamily serine protease